MPFCKYGHHMVLRDGQYGEFYGCSAYPSCKETKSIYSSSSGNRPKKNYSKSIFLGIVDVLLGASFSKSGYGRQYRLAKKTTKYVYKKSTSTYKKPNSNYKNQNYANRNKTTSQYYKQSNHPQKQQLELCRMHQIHRLPLKHREREHLLNTAH
mgnify:CR=1 FL=1